MSKLLLQRTNSRMTKPIEQVALITTTFPTPSNLSQGVFVDNLVCSLSRYVNIVVVTPSYKGQKKYFVRGISVLPFRYALASWEILAHDPGGIPVALKKKKWLYLMVPLLLFSLLQAAWRRGRKSHLLHANWAVCGAICGIVAYVLKKPLVTTLRGDDITRAKVSGINRIFLYMTVQFSDKIVAVSDAIAEYLEQAYPWAKEKIKAIYNGVNDEFIGIGALRLAEEKEKLNLLTVANLIERKGVDQILHAIALVDKRERIQFTIVGDGPEREKLENLAKHLCIEEQVVFAGRKSHEKIPQIMYEADVFILASHSEGRANVLLEAMASGLAVIASDIEGTRELVDDHSNGLLFTVGDIGKLSENIEYFFSTDRRVQYGKAAHQYILDEGLTWDNTAREYLRQYTSVMTG